MEVQKDFKELFALLNKHKVKYMIVGGYALAFYGVPRFTGDIDVFIKADQTNAKKIIKVLHDFGFGTLDLVAKDFTYQNQVIQLGFAPVRIDIVTSITGVDWEAAEHNIVKGEYGGIPVHFIGKDDFIKNKKATGRIKDLSDIEALGVDPTKIS